MSVIDKIRHYQRSIDKSNVDEERILYCITKLYNLPVTVQHLQETGVGRTVNNLRKYDGGIGNAAKALVAKWKEMVVDEESTDEEDEACVPDVPESYNDYSPESPTPNPNLCFIVEPVRKEISLQKHENYNDYSPESPTPNPNLSDEASSRKGTSAPKRESYNDYSPESPTPELSLPEAETSRKKTLTQNRESYNDYSPESPTPEASLPEAVTSRKEISAQKHRHKAGMDGSKEGSSRSSEGRSSKSESHKHNKHEKSKHSSKSEVKTDKKSSSKDSRSSKRSSKKDEEEEAKDSDLSKSGSSKKNSDKLSSSTKPSKELQNDKNHDHRKRKLGNCGDDQKNNKKRKSSQESEEDNEQHSSDSEKNNSKIIHPEVQAKSSKESSESRNKPEQVYSPKEEDKINRKRSHEKSKGSSISKSRNNESSSSVKDNEDKHRHRHKHKSDKDNERRAEKKKDSTHHSDKDSSRSKSHGPSSSKHDSENKDKSKTREHSKEKNKKEADPKSIKKEVKDKKVRPEINGDEGIDCNSGASFAEALGMCTMMPSRKRNNNSPTLHTVKVKTEPTTSSQSSSKKMVTVKVEPSDNNSSNPLSLLSPNVKLEPLNVDLASTLPEISPNYKPLPYVNHVQRKQEDKALTDVIYTKNQRTKVYSGNKSGYTSVPSLYELCIRVLIENIDALEFTGGVPYDIIKPVLERATADQLFMLEHYNPYLIEDTDSLWQFHCKREFRNKEREEMESWREMYMRCLDEREAKLKTLTANIKQSIDKSLPVRSTKLAYVDNVVKPPRNVLKKQAKYGTAGSSSASDLKKKLIAGSGPTAATNISVPPPPMPRMRTSTSSVVKKTKAPLMAKALQLIKGRYKR